MVFWDCMHTFTKPSNLFYNFPKIYLVGPRIYMLLKFYNYFSVKWPQSENKNLVWFHDALSPPPYSNVLQYIHIPCSNVCHHQLATRKRNVPEIKQYCLSVCGAYVLLPQDKVCIQVHTYGISINRLDHIFKELMCIRVKPYCHATYVRWCTVQCM